MSLFHQQIIESLLDNKQILVKPICLYSTKNAKKAVKCSYGSFFYQNDKKSSSSVVKCFRGTPPSPPMPPSTSPPTSVTSSIAPRLPSSLNSSTFKLPKYISILPANMCIKEGCTKVWLFTIFSLGPPSLGERLYFGTCLAPSPFIAANHFLGLLACRRQPLPTSTGADCRLV